MKARYFFVIAVGSLLAAVWLVTQHQQHIKSLESIIITKDQQGSDTTAGIQSLQQYVAGHMGTSSSLFLQASYDRATQQAQAAANPQSNGEVYAAAQAACAGRADSITQAHCVQDYVAAHAAPSTNPQAVTLPNRADYTKSFTGPTWTFDSTGLSFLIALAAMAMGVYTFLLHRAYPHY